MNGSSKGESFSFVLGLSFCTKKLLRGRYCPSRVCRSRITQKYFISFSHEGRPLQLYTGRSSCQSHTYDR